MNQPSPTLYESLFSDFCQIYETTLLQTETTQSVDKNLAYLQMGNHMDKILSKAEQGGIYGKKLIPNLCRDLKNKYGKGPSTRSVRYMRKFADAYNETTLHPSLSWSHYCILLSIEDTTQREQLTQQAIAQQLQRDKLQQLVSLIHQRTNKHADSFPLSPRKGTLQIAKLFQSESHQLPLLDVGFGVLTTTGSAKLSQYKNGTFVRRYSNGQYKQVQCPPGERYCYTATVDRVVDGDTVIMRILLTPGIFITERLRLRGVDAMALGTEEGEKSKRALSRMLKNKKQITIYTYSTDRYGRYIADIVADKIYINKALIQKGHARYLPMKTD